LIFQYAAPRPARADPSGRIGTPNVGCCVALEDFSTSRLAAACPRGARAARDPARAGSFYNPLITLQFSKFARRRSAALWRPIRASPGGAKKLSPLLP
jgi:hypothetical protein